MMWSTVFLPIGHLWRLFPMVSSLWVLQTHSVHWSRQVISVQWRINRTRIYIQVVGYGFVIWYLTCITSLEDYLEVCQAELFRKLLLYYGFHRRLYPLETSKCLFPIDGCTIFPKGILSGRHLRKHNIGDLQIKKGDLTLNFYFRFLCF